MFGRNGSAYVEAEDDACLRVLYSWFLDFQHYRTPMVESDIGAYAARVDTPADFRIPCFHFLKAACAPLKDLER